MPQHEPPARSPASPCGSGAIQLCPAPRAHFGSRARRHAMPLPVRRRDLVDNRVVMRTVRVSLSAWQPPSSCACCLQGTGNRVALSPRGIDVRRATPSLALPLCPACSEHVLFAQRGGETRIALMTLLGSALGGLLGAGAGLTLTPPRPSRSRVGRRDGCCRSPGLDSGPELPEEGKPLAALRDPDRSPSRELAYPYS